MPEQSQRIDAAYFRAEAFAKQVGWQNDPESLAVRLVWLMQTYDNLCAQAAPEPLLNAHRSLIGELTGAINRYCGVTDVP